MTRPSRSLPALVLTLVAVLALAACGGSTPSATSGSGVTAAPAATEAPGATTEPDATEPGGSAGEINIGGAAANLENLDNYSFRIEMKSEGASEGMMGLVAAGGSLVMEGSVQLKPTEAADVRMIMSDGSTESTISYRIVGDTAYTAFGDTWMATPADEAGSAIDSLKPDQLLSGYSDISGLAKVGEEDKNGIPSEHFQSTEDPGIGGLFGLPEASWTMDVWLAKDGGFPVSTVIVAEGKSDTGETGKFTMSVDVTSVNDPNLVIEAPEDVMELPS
jgi:hypothetical protein